MTITLDKLLNGSPGRNHDIVKASQTSKAAGSWHSLWKAAGYPTAGANPPLFTAGSGYVPTRATTGALGQANAAGGNEKCFGAAQIGLTTAGTLILYDRLWACSGMSANVTTAQSVTTPGALPSGRQPGTDGEEVEPWFECYTATGATGTGVYTLTGTDSTGTTGRTWTYTRGSATTEIAGQMAPFVPVTAVGGCRAVASVTLSVATGTVGDFGVTLMRRTGAIGVLAANVLAQMDALVTGAPRCYDDTCYALMIQCTTTNTGVLQGQITIPEFTQ